MKNIVNLSNDSNNTYLVNLDQGFGNTDILKVSKDQLDALIWASNNIMGPDGGGFWIDIIQRP